MAVFAVPETWTRVFNPSPIEHTVGQKCQNWPSVAPSAACSVVPGVGTWWGVVPGVVPGYWGTVPGTGTTTTTTVLYPAPGHASAARPSLACPLLAVSLAGLPGCLLGVLAGVLVGVSLWVSSLVCPRWCPRGCPRWCVIDGERRARVRYGPDRGPERGASH